MLVMRSFPPTLMLLLAMPGLASAQPGPSCAAVRTDFTTGAYAQREAIVDALQDRFKAAGADHALGRDGKVQAVMLALMRCGTAPQDDFMQTLDRAASQVTLERASHRGD